MVGKKSLCGSTGVDRLSVRIHVHNTLYRHVNRTAI